MYLLLLYSILLHLGAHSSNLFGFPLNSEATIKLLTLEMGSPEVMSYSLHIEGPTEVIIFKSPGFSWQDDGVERCALTSSYKNTKTTKVEVKVAQSCPTLCNPLDCPWNSPGQNTGVGGLALLQRICPTQGLNPSLLHCRWILYQLSHQGSPRTLEWVAYLFFSGFPNPGIEPGSPALQADSLPTALSGEPSKNPTYC